MFEKALVMYIYAETPIHPGTGTNINKAVDLPIQRERHTDFPIIQGSSVKGVLRNTACSFELDEKCKGCDKKPESTKNCEILKKLFGTPDGIGGISVTDSKILAFPVRSLKGVFCWITSPLVLERYKRDMNLIGVDILWNIPKPSNDEEVKACKNQNLVENGYLYIEDLQLKFSDDENVNKIAQKISEALPDNDVYKDLKEKLKKDFVIVSNDVFRNLINLATEVTARIAINPETGTVSEHALWYEEYLPADTIMYSLILLPRRMNNLKSEEYIKKYDKQIIQIGGDETVGKGFAKISIGGRKNA